MTPEKPRASNTALLGLSINASRQAPLWQGRREISAMRHEPSPLATGLWPNGPGNDTAPTYLLGLDWTSTRGPCPRRQRRARDKPSAHRLSDRLRRDARPHAA